MPVVEGHDQVLSRLRDLQTDVERRILRAGLKDGAAVILPVAKQLAAKHRRSGTMEENLQVRNGGGGKKAVRINVGASQKGFTGEAFYTGFVLWGHKIGRRPRPAIFRTSKVVDTRGSVKGDDFIAAAYEQTKQPALDTAMTSMATRIERIAEGKAASGT